MQNGAAVISPVRGPGPRFSAHPHRDSDLVIYLSVAFLVLFRLRRRLARRTDLRLVRAGMWFAFVGDMYLDDVLCGNRLGCLCLRANICGIGLGVRDLVSSSIAYPWPWIVFVLRFRWRYRMP